MDFLKLLKQLNSHKVEFVVAGGYASILLGSDMNGTDLSTSLVKFKSMKSA